MKSNLIKVLGLALIMTACVSIPKETVTLSKTLGEDLAILHSSHRNMVLIYYGQIKTDINSFIDEKYAPFIINYVLKAELANYQSGAESIYGAIHDAAEVGNKEKTDEALVVMQEFLEAARNQISKKRGELLDPILKQENEILNKIDQSYHNAIYANATLTGYLESVQKVKKSQSEALSIIGLEGADEEVTNRLIQLSDLVNTTVKQGKEIDIKSDDAYKQMEEITKKIKEITNKNKEDGK